MQEYARTFRVRYHECDAYGHVNNTNYVRYLSETTLDALARAGYSIERCAAQGLIWQPQRLEIEYLRPLRYGERVRVTSRVTGLAGPALSQAYEFLIEDSGEPAARAQTEARLADRATGESVAAPPDMLAALCPPELPAKAPGWEPLPAAPPPPPGVFKIRHTVTWPDLGLDRRVDPTRYLDWIEMAGFGVIAAHGWPAPRMANQGFGILMRRHQVAYLSPAALGDELEIATWASEIKRATAMRHYTVTRLADGALLLRCHTLGVWVNLAAGRPIRIPPDFLADFAPNLVY